MQQCGWVTNRIAGNIGEGMDEALWWPQALPGARTLEQAGRNSMRDEIEENQNVFKTNWKRPLPWMEFIPEGFCMYGLRFVIQKFSWDSLFKRLIVIDFRLPNDCRCSKWLIVVASNDWLSLFQMTDCQRPLFELVKNFLIWIWIVIQNNRTKRFLVVQRKFKKKSRNENRDNGSSCEFFFTSNLKRLIK